MIIRNDIEGTERAPRSIVDFLEQRGGINPNGEPIFRLVWSETRMRFQGGRWQDWDKNLSQAQRGGMIRTPAGLMVPSYFRPYRTVVEVRKVRKYRFDPGWVLERWIPTSYYGAQGDWNMRCVPGSTVPYGGPYPVDGDYEMCHVSSSRELPSLSQLVEAMDRSRRSTEQDRKDVSQIVLERHNEAVWQYEEKMRKEREEEEAWMNDITSTLLSSSLEMGRHRTEMAERQGIREHVGA